MQIKLLRTIFFFLTIFCSLSLHAQSLFKREAGFQLAGLNFDGHTSFGGFYKKQLSENKYRRIRLFTGRAFTEVSSESVQANVFASAAIGREKRKSLDSRLEFYRGPEFSLNAGFQQLNERTVFSLMGGVGYVLGLQHSFNDQWAIQIETVPSIRVGASFVDWTYRSRLLDVNISNSVALGVVRKF